MKRIPSKLKLILIIGLLALMACTTFHSVVPIYPEVANPYYPATVDSLQPTLRWKPWPGVDMRYDLIIYESIKVEAFGQAKEQTQLRRVYYREGLEETAHRLEAPLQPNTQYFWSVRVRSGEKVSGWSLYDRIFFMPYGYVRTYNRYFTFKTP